jgi:hypothetical protein
VNLFEKPEQQNQFVTITPQAPSYGISGWSRVRLISGADGGYRFECRLCNLVVPHSALKVTHCGRTDSISDLTESQRRSLPVYRMNGGVPRGIIPV